MGQTLEIGIELYTDTLGDATTMLSEQRLILDEKKQRSNDLTK